MSADFLLYDQHAQLAVMVGFTGQPESTAEWATEIMDDFLRGARPPYLVLVNRDQTYFWVDPARHQHPAGIVGTSDLLAKYLHKFNLSLPTLDSDTFEMVIEWWLVDATRGTVEVPDLLRNIGFIDAIRNADVKAKSAA